MAHRSALLGLALFAVASCSGGAGSSAGTASPAIDVFEYTAAFGLGSSDAAWNLVSSRCKAVVNEAEFRATVTAAGELATGLAASNISVDMDGSTALVDYDTNDPSIGSFVDQPWILEDGRWRWDAC